MITRDGSLIVVSGASRSGKTAYVRQQVKPDRRIVAWDPEDQWCRLPGWIRVTKQSDLFRLCESGSKVRAGYVAGGNLQKEFDFWAGCVQYAGRYISPLVAIAEELADVTTPSKAPGNWGILLRRGLKRGITIYAISQRWSEADKTAVGNASQFVLFRQSSGDDVRYLSRKTRVPVADLEKLLPLEFVRMNALNGVISHGKLRF